MVSGFQNFNIGMCNLYHFLCYMLDEDFKSARQISLLNIVTASDLELILSADILHENKQ